MTRLIARLGVVLALVLALGGPTAVTRASAEGDSSLGSTTVPDQKFLQGCHRYRANYKVKVATNQWSGYIQFYSPSGKRAVGAFIDDGPGTPKVGQVTIRLCHQSWRAGRWRAVLKLIYTQGGVERRGRSEPNYFRLYR